MAIPFGFSVGDFLAVSKLIGQVAVELHENGEAAPEYRSLLIELEALERALRKLQTLRPAKYELFQLTSIRATALACQRPLQSFLDKISKFESRLGTTSAAHKGWKDLPRRMQFKIMFKEDIKQLRSSLASHVATINLLLMTQAVASISAAEDDRDRLASGLESRIIAQRRLLEDMKDHVHASLERQQEIKTELCHQSSILDDLGKKADKTRQQLSGQESGMEDIKTITTQTGKQTKSILVTMTEVLSLVASGLIQLRQIAKQLRMMIRVCATFITEMRTAMVKLMELFLSLQTILQRIDRNLPPRVYLPTVQLTTALGETMALPYQLCQQWTTFTELLRVIFLDKPGESRVNTGKYFIVNARGGRVLGKGSWQHVVKQDDHLSMCIVLDNFTAWSDHCSFPTWQAFTEGFNLEKGSRTCHECGHIEMRPTGNNTGPNNDRLIDKKDDIEFYRHIDARSFMNKKVDIELYQHIYAPRLTEIMPLLDDALNLLCLLKAHFTNQPDSYNKYLHFVADFERGDIDLTEVIERVLSILAGDPTLVQKFKRFLPHSYTIE